MDVTTIAVCLITEMGLLGAVTGFIVRRLEKKLDKRQAENNARDAARRQNEIMMIETMNAAIALGEATARAVQRIPDARCNGDMHAALEYATSIKHKHKDFITKQGIESLY